MLFEDCKGNFLLRGTIPQYENIQNPYITNEDYKVKGDKFTFCPILVRSFIVLLMSEGKFWIRKIQVAEILKNKIK